MSTLDGPSASAQGGARVPTGQGTGDRIELPMVGPSKRTIIAKMPPTSSDTDVSTKYISAMRL